MIHRLINVFMVVIYEQTQDSGIFNYELEMELVRQQKMSIYIELLLDITVDIFPCCTLLLIPQMHSLIKHNKLKSKQSQYTKDGIIQ